MKVVVACDHNGLNMKKAVIDTLKQMNYEFVDLGCDTDESVDYPDLVEKLVSEIQENPDIERGILCGNTGHEMSIAANRFSGIFSIASADGFTIELCRSHENVNIICFGASWGVNCLAHAIDKFLHTPFDEEKLRHKRRLDKIR